MAAVAHASDIYSLDVIEIDGRAAIVSSAMDTTLLVSDAETGEKRCAFTGSESGSVILDSVLTEDGPLVASADWERVFLWNATDCVELTAFDVDDVAEADFSRIGDELVLVAAESDMDLTSRMVVWDLTGEIVSEWSILDGYVLDVEAMDDEGSPAIVITVVNGDKEAFGRVHSVQGGDLRREWIISEASGGLYPTPYADAVNVEDGAVVIVADEETGVDVMFSDGRRYGTYDEHGGFVTKVAVVAVNDVLIAMTLGMDGIVHIWNVATREPIMKHPASIREVSAAVVGDQAIFAFSYATSVYTWTVDI